MEIKPITTAHYKITLPSTGMDINVRPWSVAEGKIFMLAQGDPSPLVILRAVKQVVDACWLDSDKNVGALTSYDLDYVFLQLRAKSVGENIRVEVKNKEGKRKTTSILLESVRVHRYEGHDRQVKITPETTLFFRDPRVMDTEFVLEQKTKNPTYDVDLLLAAKSVDKVQQYDKVGDADSCDFTCLYDMICGLTTRQFQPIERFFETLPRLRHEIKLDELWPGDEDTHVLEGIRDFFA